MPIVASSDDPIIGLKSAVRTRAGNALGTGIGALGLLRPRECPGRGSTDCTTAVPCESGRNDDH